MSGTNIFVQLNTHLLGYCVTLQSYDRHVTSAATRGHSPSIFVKGTSRIMVVKGKL
jgi:hypothetical protein